MNKKLAEKESEMQNLTQQMKQLELDRSQTLAQTREEMSKLQREMEAINQKKEELAQLRDRQEDSHRSEIIDLQNKISDMEAHLRVTQAKYLQADQQERYLEELRVQEPLSSSTIAAGLQSALTWSDSFVKLLWGRPKSPLLEPMAAYTLQSCEERTERPRVSELLFTDETRWL